MDKRLRPTGDDLKKYILDNLDRAISEGWITAYYQPVARTLTNEICGMEALARWIDPEYGMFPPDAFIGVLENAKLIHKLDSHIIHCICDDYARSMKEDDRIVTVSFNLSRLDFKLMDVHSVIEAEIREHKVPRDAFRVEITESMMDSDEERMHEAIDRFWDRGFRVWMDDFGSGYSSLNVLKDYRFDTLKIDMVFLRDFNARSREIVKSVVDMSKRIGVHTLAEGVETEEQLEFLRSIGCEKAQGYFIGKPMPYKECLAYLKEKGYRLESPAKRQYYHDIGKVNVLSATPMHSFDIGDDNKEYSEGQIPIAFVEYSGEQIYYLFANESYKRTIKALGVDSLDEIEGEFKRGDSPLREKFLSMIHRAKDSDEVVGLDFIRGKNYCFAQVRAIAGYPGGNAFLCVLQNLSEDTLMSRNTLLSEHLRSLCSIYEMITLVDLNTGYSETIFSGVQTKHTYNKRPAAEELKDYAEQEIYPEDREKFVQFTDMTTIEKRISESTTRHISAPFRTVTSGGTYVWSLYSFLFDGDSSERRILSCFRRLSPEAVARLHGDSVAAVTDAISVSNGNKITPEILWKNFRNNSDTGFFWKDKNRRFIGVNKKFLDYYGFDSEDELIGKTDEDVGWHVDPEPYKADEERVLAGEGQTYLVPGTCICRGEIRNILASKMPIYVDGEIVGLMGYFLDVTDQKGMDIEIKQLIQNDQMTGTLNFLGMMEALLKYQDGYAFDQADFAMIMFDVSHFHIFSENYGHEWSSHLLKAVSSRIQEVVGVKGIAGRLYTDHFMVVRQLESRSEAEDIISRVDDSIEEISSIDGVPCSIYLYSAYTLFSETKDLQDLFKETDDKLKELEGKGIHRKPKL
ncbi:MAG: EAL domain-containing protein [Lachnospiraceae bacterium]|nr:EAL domain-containing protein [Lachnospiraceae bacterium]